MILLLKAKIFLGSLKLYGRTLFPFKVNQRNYVYLNDVFFNFQERDFAKFDETGPDGLFRDSNFSLTLNDEFHFLDEPEVTIGFLTTYQHRSNLFAEFYFNPEETANYNGFALTSYYISDHLLTQKHGITLATKVITQNSPQINKNIINQSGEGLYPFLSFGEHIRSLSR